MNNDTVNLLKDCNSGCKNATDSMEQVLGMLNDGELKTLIEDVNTQHIQIGDECHQQLNRYGYNEKDPSPVAKVMSFISTEIKMLNDDSEQKAAEIMTDGCNMGIKTICSSINQYPNADAESKNLAHRLVTLEQDFVNRLKKFL